MLLLFKMDKDENFSYHKNCREKNVEERLKDLKWIQDIGERQYMGESTHGENMECSQVRLKIAGKDKKKDCGQKATERVFGEVINRWNFLVLKCFKGKARANKRKITNLQSLHFVECEFRVIKHEFHSAYC